MVHQILGPYPYTSIMHFNPDNNTLRRKLNAVHRIMFVYMSMGKTIRRFLSLSLSLLGDSLHMLRWPTGSYFWRYELRYHLDASAGIREFARIVREVREDLSQTLLVSDDNAGLVRMRF